MPVCGAEHFNGKDREMILKTRVTDPRDDIGFYVPVTISGLACLAL